MLSTDKRPDQLRRTVATTLAALLFTASPAMAQVTGKVELSDGYGVAHVRNGSSDMTNVTVELRQGEVRHRRVVLGEPVLALVSPAEFPLAPGETQTVRLLVRERVASGTVLRLVTTFTPIPDEPPEASDAPNLKLVFATRYVTKVLVP